MTDPERTLLEIIDTGPAEIKELMSCAPKLMQDELPDHNTRTSDVPGLIDRLDSRGHIGRTGSLRETIVISALGFSILNSN